MLSKKSPQLRFKGFTDDWEDRNLKDILREFSTKSKIENEYRVLSSTNVGMEFRDGRVSGTSNLGYKIIKNGDLVLSPQNLWLGNININNIGTGLVSPSYKTFNFTDIDSSFIKPQLRTPKMLEEYKNSSTQGASVVRRNLEIDSFYQIKIATPSIKEQEKIGSFFKHLDSTISLHQRKLDLLKEQKKGYLQKMFPKNGEKVPELRFEGFADDWEERKLSSGLREYTDRVIVEDDKEYYQISVRNNFGGITLRGSKMGNKIGRKRQAKINLTKYPQTLIFTRQTVEQGGIGWVDKYCDGAIVTENMPTISLDTSVFSKYFLTNLFQTRIFYKNAILDNVEGGSAQIAIHESKFLSSTLLFPNLDEQEKIGQFFKQLDNTITLHQRKLDLLKEQKKGFLQKMFV